MISEPQRDTGPSTLVPSCICTPSTYTFTHGLSSSPLDEPSQTKFSQFSGMQSVMVNVQWPSPYVRHPRMHLSAYTSRHAHLVMYVSTCTYLGSVSRHGRACASPCAYRHARPGSMHIGMHTAMHMREHRIASREPPAPVWSVRCHIYAMHHTCTCPLVMHTHGTRHRPQATPAEAHASASPPSVSTH